MTWNEFVTLSQIFSSASCAWRSPKSKASFEKGITSCFKKGWIDEKCIITSSGKIALEKKTQAAGS